MLEGARVMRDGARLITACEREPAVQPPQRGQLTVRKLLAQRVRGASERGGGLREVVLQQIRLGQRGTGGQFILATERTGAQQRCEHLRGLGAAPALERGIGAGERGGS